MVYWPLLLNRMDFYKSEERKRRLLIDQNENRPVMHISWYEAIAFCN